MHPPIQNLLIRPCREVEGLAGRSQKQRSSIHKCNLLTPHENIKWCENPVSDKIAKLFACNKEAKQESLKNKIAMKVQFREKMLCQPKKVWFLNELILYWVLIKLLLYMIFFSYFLLGFIFIYLLMASVDLRTWNKISSGIYNQNIIDANVTRRK